MLPVNRSSRRLIGPPGTLTSASSPSHSFSCLWVAFAYSMRYLVRLLYVTDDLIADMAPAASLLLVPAIFIGNWTAIYDPLVLVTGALGLILILKRMHTWYYVFFPLAVLNKITAIIFTCGFVAREFRKVSNTRLVVHIAVQIVIWAVLMAGLTLLFKDNPGTKAHFQLFWNLGQFVFHVPIFPLTLLVDLPSWIRLPGRLPVEEEPRGISACLRCHGLALRSRGDDLRKSFR